MFLRRFKEKSNQKYINKALNTRKFKGSGHKIKSVGVLIHAKAVENIKGLEGLIDTLGIAANKVKFLGFVEDEKDNANHWVTVFSPKDLGWNGQWNSSAVKDFMNTEFDALISFYPENVMELELVTVLSQAHFKIGIPHQNDSLHDLTLNVALDNQELYVKEILKYLNILKKL